MKEIAKEWIRARNMAREVRRENLTLEVGDVIGHGGQRYKVTAKSGHGSYTFVGLPSNDVEMECLNARLRRDPKNSILAIMGHIDGDFILGHYNPFDWNEAVNKLWTLYDKF